MKLLFLTDGSDLAGVITSTEIKYMKVLRSSLGLLAAWPYEGLGLTPTAYARIMKIYLLLQYFVCWALQLLYIKWNFGVLDMFTMSHNYITFLMNCVSMSRQCLPFSKKYQEVSRAFIQDVHLYHHRGKSDYAMKVHIQVHKLSHFFTMYFMCIMALGIIMFNATPFVSNISSGVFEEGNPNNATYEYAVYYALPFDSERTNFAGFLSVTLYNVYISICCTASFFLFDLHLSLMAFHMCGHLKILKHSLETFVMPQGGVDADWKALMFSEQESYVVIRKLKECVDHHRYILEFSAKMSDAFGPMLFIYYTFHQISGCLLLLECSQMDTRSLVRYGLLTVGLFQQLIQLSIIFELVGVMSENLVDAVYSVPWECMGTRDRKLVQVLLKKVQTSMHLKAMGLADVGVQAMASIIKTSLSYFMFLRSSNE